MDTTAKVDIRKLQLLNDRINQTIEALNQVRLSVHGLSHSTGQGFGQNVGQNAGFQFGQNFGGAQNTGAAGFGQTPGYGQNMGWAQNPAWTQNTGWNHNPGYGQNVPQTAGYGQNLGFGAPFQGGNVQGYSHTAGINQGFGVDPRIAAQNPVIAQLLAAGINPFMGGLSHTGQDGSTDSTGGRGVTGNQGWGQNAWGQNGNYGVDPYFQARMFQSFPFAQWPMLPGAGW